MCVWGRGAFQAESTTSAKALRWSVLGEEEEQQAGPWGWSSRSKGKMVGNEASETGPLGQVM